MPTISTPLQSLSQYNYRESWTPKFKEDRQYIIVSFSNDSFETAKEWVGG